MHPAGAMEGEQLGTGRIVVAAPSDHEEVEWQFDAPDLPRIARWLETVHVDPRLDVGPPEEAALRDVYLDTEDARLHRAGYALRVRRANGHGEATLKALVAAANGLARRREISEPIGSGAPAALSDWRGPVGDRVRAVAGRMPLQTLFEIRTRRRRFPVRLDGACVAELALDETTIGGGRVTKPQSLTRVEVEVTAGAVAQLTPFVDTLKDALHLGATTRSKYEAGLAAAGLEAPAEPDLGPTKIDASMSVGAAAYAVLRGHVVRLLAAEPGTRLGEDIEALHDMRVASRRLRVAMKLFAAVLPARLARQCEEIRRVGRALGAVRDLDVHLAELETWAATRDPADAAALEPLLVGVAAPSRPGAAASAARSRRPPLRALGRGTHSHARPRAGATPARGTPAGGGGRAGSRAPPLPQDAQARRGDRRRRARGGVPRASHQL